MYTSFRRYKIDPKNLNEILRLVNEGYLPIVSRSVGFVSYSLFSDDNEHVCSVSVFTTRAGMEEANETAIEWARQHLVPLLPPSLDISSGEALLYKYQPAL